MAQEGLGGIALLEAPAGEAADRRRQPFEVGRLLRQEQLRRIQARQLFAQRAPAGQGGRGEFAGGDVGVGQPDALVVKDDGGEKVVLPGVQHARFDDRTGGKDAHHLARHQTVDRCGADLLAEGDLVAAGDQFGDIPFGRMVGNAAHGDPLALGNGAPGEDQVQLAGRHVRVIVEHFVEVAQAKEDDGVRVLRLDVEILLPGGCVALFGCGHS